MHPMQKFCAPGGCWMVKVLALTFQATLQPASQPWPEPRLPRLEYATPALSDVRELGKVQSSHSRPVAQRWCGAKPRSSAWKLSSTSGPANRDCATAGQTLLLRPRTEHLFRNNCVPLKPKSAGPSPLCGAVCLTITLSNVICLTVLAICIVFCVS